MAKARVNKVYGYCRISRKEQNIERQVRNIKAVYPDALIIQEAYTGTKLDGRKQLEGLIATVKSGDKIVFDSVSRMSRNADEGFELYKQLYARGVELEFLKEPHINTSTYKAAQAQSISGCAPMTGDKPTDALLSDMFAAVDKYTLALAARQIQLAFTQAQKEVDDLHQRTKEGIQTARAAGKQIGAVKGKRLNVKKAAPAKELILKHCKTFGGALNDAETIKVIGIARNTFYKYKRELLDELAENT